MLLHNQIAMDHTTITTNTIIIMEVILINNIWLLLPLKRKYLDIIFRLSFKI